jgi:hypothetical protein
MIVMLLLMDFGHFWGIWRPFEEKSWGEVGR